MDEEKNFLKRLDELVSRSQKRYSTERTDFLPIRLQNIARDHLEKNGESYLFCGGFEQAERQRLILFPPYTEIDCQEAEISLIRLQGRMDFVKVSHRDFLGAVLSLGVKREKFGDLLVTEDGCYLYMATENKDYLLSNPLKVKNVPLSTQEISLEEWTPPKPITKEIAVTVSSLRLDAICAHGFGLSRAKALEAIKSSKVQLNHLETTDGDALVKTDDILSFRGKGKIKIGEILGETKKGKLRVNLQKYI